MTPPHDHIPGTTGLPGSDAANTAPDGVDPGLDPGVGPDGSSAADPAGAPLRAAGEAGISPTSQTSRATQQPAPGSESQGGFEVALGHLDAEILAGRYSNGTRLPAERELAAQLGVSRGAVREAIRVLQAQGILVSGTGRGAGTRVQATPTNAMGRILRLQLALDLVSFADLTESRVALECAACSAAAVRREPEPLDRARALQDRMRAELEPDPFNELDTQFHVALAEAGANRLMSDLTVAIRRAVHDPISRAEHALTDWQQFRSELVAHHDAILDAIIEGDPHKAARLTEDHIRSAYQLLFN
nr:FadR/GntR family transcriptional regulator [Acidipropionibacterium jensenii]